MGPLREEILLIVLGGRRYGLPAALVRELVSAVAIERLPASSPRVEGVVNVRGHVIPVYDLRAELGLPPKGVALSDHLVFFYVRESVAACRIDGAIALVEAEIDSSHEGANRVAKLPDGLVPILDLSEVFFRSGSGGEAGGPR